MATLRDKKAATKIRKTTLGEWKTLWEMEKYKQELMGWPVNGIHCCYGERRGRRMGWGSLLSAIDGGWHLERGQLSTKHVDHWVFLHQLTTKSIILTDEIVYGWLKWGRIRTDMGYQRTEYWSDDSLCIIFLQDQSVELDRNDQDGSQTARLEKILANCPLVRALSRAREHYLSPKTWVILLIFGKRAVTSLCVRAILSIQRPILIWFL